MCPQGSNQQYTSFCSDNSLAQNRRQTTNLTKDDLVYWRIYASLGINRSVYIHIAEK